MVESTLNCPRCDAVTSKDDDFCGECGDRLDIEQAPHPAFSESGSSKRPKAALEPSRFVNQSSPPRPAKTQTNLPPIEKYIDRLREVFGYPNLRDGQARVLDALNNTDVLAVMPTGSGKSLCYVLPAMELGMTVVVSPLIALMQDQVEALQAAGVAATFINSNLNHHEQNQRYLAFIRGEIQLLYVSPERFANPEFTSGLAHAGVELFAVDEAHCISEWGHNFRPDYLQLGEIRELIGHPRTLALTATANPQVRQDIRERLRLSRTASEIVTTVDRPNLTLTVVPITGMPERRQWLIDFIGERRDQSGIVYARTRRNVEEITAALQAEGLDAEAYHAGLDRTHRSTIQRGFMLGETSVIVATNAFGMGIDKPDVRFVVHFQLPPRIEAYYQEAGRAGRDGDPASCVLLYSRRDRTTQQRFIEMEHPDDKTVRDTWLRWIEIANSETGHLPSDVGSSDREQFGLILSTLRDSGLIDPVERKLLSLDPSASIDMRSVKNHRDYAETRLSEMTEYAETKSCRRALVLRYFGENPPEECANCDNCLGIAVREDIDYPPELFDELLELRDQIVRTTNREPFRIFENRTAREIAAYRPRDRESLLRIWGIGETRADWLGSELIAVIDRWSSAHPEAEPPEMPEKQRPKQQLNLQRNFGPNVDIDDPLIEALRAWRSERARRDGVPAYTLFSDRTLRELVANRPTEDQALLNTWGLGESRVDRFGSELIKIIKQSSTPH